MAEIPLHLPAARELVDENENAELHLYPGDGHLFAEQTTYVQPPSAGLFCKTAVNTSSICVAISVPPFSLGGRMRLRAA